jgi:uncharacterized protein YjbI with pentapeptide repeats
VDFSGADLSGADLSFDKLGGSTELQGADLASAILVRTLLQGARYSEHSRFPEKFDPGKAGMVLAHSAA